MTKANREASPPEYHSEIYKDADAPVTPECKRVSPPINIFEIDWEPIKDLPIRPAYKFNEGELIQEINDYIDATYKEHYAGDTYQATDIIIDAGHGIGFTLGNVIKYAKRYGKKEGFNRKDLLKLIHYSFLALYVHDLNEENAKEIR